MTAPVSAKVSTGLTTGAAVSAVTWALTTFVPAWHAGLPDQLAGALPAFVGLAAYFVGAYLAKHRATAAEIQRSLNDAIEVIEAYRAQAQPPLEELATGRHTPPPGTL